MAFQRLENTEKRLKRIPELGKAYKDCIKRYVEKGYVAKVPADNYLNSKWFLPHFPLLRPDKDTTKTRIVFDAAAKFEDVALNDQIYQGPKLQHDLFSVLLRFRRYPVALMCDIEEMYLRIVLLSPTNHITDSSGENWTNVAAQMSMNSIASYSALIRRHSRLNSCFSNMRGSTRAYFLSPQKRC